jgi:hypothetical protein
MKRIPAAIGLLVVAITVTPLGPNLGHLDMFGRRSRREVRGRFLKN